MSDEYDLHAIYAPSGAPVWSICTAQAEAVAQLPPEEEREEAREGTEAHKEIERCLGPLNGEFVDPATMPIKPPAKDHPAAYGIATLIAYVRGLPPGNMWVERRVELTKDIWGRRDIGHWHEETRTLTTVDFKNGFVGVDAEENEQLRIYAAGGIYTDNLPALWLRYAVVQPNDFRPVPRVKQWVESADSLYQFATRIAGIPAGMKQFVAGEHCRDCRLFGMCEPTRDILKHLGAMMAGLAGDVPAEKVAMFLNCEKPIEHWFEALRTAHAKRALATGKVPPGMKLVTSQSKSAWIDEDAARDAVIAAKGVEALKPPTPTQAKEMGVDVSKLARTPPGGPVLAFESDKRKSWAPKSAAEMFKDVVVVAK